MSHEGLGTICSVHRPPRIDERRSMTSDTTRVTTLAVDSPLGALYLVSTSLGIVRLIFDDEDRARALATINDKLGSPPPTPRGRADDATAIGPHTVDRTTDSGSSPLTDPHRHLEAAGRQLG